MLHCVKLRPAVISVAFVIAFLVSGPLARAQECPDAELCRPGGALLHQPNSNGHLIWTTPKCQGPNAPTDWSNGAPSHPDKICQQISSCTAAGGFGRFLQAVTGGCHEKHFDGYFGLDGMTFGILDWTSDNLPRILQAYQLRGKDKFEQLFGPLNLPIKNGCLDPKWACNSNKQGELMCAPGFHRAFKSSLRTAEFQKAQIDYALKEYEKRIARFSSLALQTDYGNVAMAVVANNLLPTKACRPATWKKVCEGQTNERKLVDCMLQEYGKYNCRGSQGATQQRLKAIKRVFAGAQSTDIVHPTADAVIACSDSWGQGN
jgi:hypothetical protein